MSLRDLVLFVVVFGAIPFILRRPYLGVLCWVWLGLMNPHRLTWGAAFNFEFAQIVAIATFAGLLLTKDELRWKAGWEVYVLIALLLWVSITTLFAMEPHDATEQWQRVMKIQVMGLVALVVLHSRRHVELLVWVLALSVGFYGVKGGVFTILTGGQFRVWGPAGSYIYDNNALALATVMTIPLLYYLFTEAKQRWLKLGLAGAMVLCAFSVLGSHSRGAILAIAVMGVFLWLHSRNKLVFGLVLALVAPLLLAFMPEKWEERMQTILDHQDEGSAQARLVTWEMLVRIANDRFFGAGFEPYTPNTWAKYMPEWPTVHSAHSIYFQVLGEHGWVGLVLFLLMWFLVWRCSAWIIKNTRRRDDLKWAYSLSSMIRVSLVGYFVGGIFLNLAYWDFPYYELVLLVVLRDLIRRVSSGGAERSYVEAGETQGNRMRGEQKPVPTWTRAVMRPAAMRSIETDNPRMSWDSGGARAPSSDAAKSEGASRRRMRRDGGGTAGDRSC